MKAKALMTILCFIGIATTSEAQLKKVKMRNNQSASFSPVNKGYYAIGRNAEKLNTSSSDIVVQETYKAPDVKKGYYGIGNNSAQLKRRQGIRQQEKKAGVHATQKRNQPVKGYYGIGRNAEKFH